ncbi:MAG: SIS domain-containing protein, partial [Acidimicrobiia bacterium]
MCGIVAVLRRPPTRAVPGLEGLIRSIEEVNASLSAVQDDASSIRLETVLAAASKASEVDRLLRGVPGTLALNADRLQTTRLAHVIEDLSRLVHLIENVDVNDVEAIETYNAAVIDLKDSAWALASDRLRTADAIRSLARDRNEPHAIAAYWSIQQALSSLDRLEVRGRDSAGLHVLVTGSQVDEADPAVAAMVAQRSDSLFRDGSVRVASGCWSLVYKAAAEIGELGDNTRALRSAIESDELLRVLLRAPSAEVTVIAHTRWASVGIISEANAHPVNSEETSDVGAPYVISALNGDVDNHVDLRARGGLTIAGEITTDAKVIPTLIARSMSNGAALADAFRSTVETFEGSVAIAASSVEDPRNVQLALRGSGQALYIGVAEDAYIVASEPYGFIEEAPLGLRLDGEAINNPANPVASQGQIVCLRADLAGTIEGIERVAYDGTPLPVEVTELTSAGITTRDIDRGASPHFLLKEIGEAPASFEKTLRGKLLDRDGHLVVELAHSTLPSELRERIRGGDIRHITVIGQGTAAVAGQAVATSIRDALGAGSEITVTATLATELSGFGTEQDLSKHLVVAVSQSGTTTDTNRTVDVVRAAGAKVIAIVNRRGSDLTDKADGVLYTADGRDVEMSVASTKAFYAQVAAGFLLGWGIAAELGRGQSAEEQEVLRALRAVPDAMRAVLARRESIAEAARAHSPIRRYWAVVGNGPNRVAANEVRIKLSELCYKSIASDATEDKKHIDLSAEPMILVCAAGLTGSNADDVAKELAIYRAHKAAAVVIASEDDPRFASALNVIAVPR